MKSLELIKKYCIFEEAILDSVSCNNLVDAVLTIKISEWNFTMEFGREWNIPIDHEIARERIFELFEGESVGVLCKNLTLLRLNRVRYRLPDSFLGQPELPLAPDWQEIRKTIIGFSILESSALLDELGQHRNLFHHVAIETNEGSLDVLCQDIEILNWPKTTK